ncbi:glycosyltransferase family 2 protein [Roseibium sp. M-1]
MNSQETSAAIECSIIIPCFNEVAAIEQTVREIIAVCADGLQYEIIVIDDGSTDGTADVLARLSDETGLVLFSHSKNRGYGAALKTGLRHARGALVAITDADGTYPNHCLPELIAKCRNYDMVVGARTGDDVTYSKIRSLPKLFLRAWISWLSRCDVPDINSGLRVFNRQIAEKNIGILPDGFSFTITITLAMLTTYRDVLFVPVSYKQRVGKSKIRPIRDTMNFVFLILRTALYFAPLRAFFPIILFFATVTLFSLGYDILVLRDITDLTVLLIMFTLNAGMVSLMADMIVRRTQV